MTLLCIEKYCRHWFPPLEPVLCDVNALIRYYEVWSFPTTSTCH